MQQQPNEAAALAKVYKLLLERSKQRREKKDPANRPGHVEGKGEMNDERKG